jgi:hypothetical protein
MVWSGAVVAGWICFCDVTLASVSEAGDHLPSSDAYINECLVLPSGCSAPPLLMKYIAGFVCTLLFTSCNMKSCVVLCGCIGFSDVFAFDEYPCFPLSLVLFLAHSEHYA